MTRPLAFSVLLALALPWSACSRKSDEAPPATAPATSAPAQPSGDAVAKAKEAFAQRCTPCHGPSGDGDGPASAGLNPKPRRFSDGEWQKTIDDAHIMKVIKLGGAAVGKSAAMPGNPDLNEPVVAALKDLVRSFAK